MNHTECPRVCQPNESWDQTRIFMKVIKNRAQGYPENGCSKSETSEFNDAKQESRGILVMKVRYNSCYNINQFSLSRLWPRRVGQVAFVIPFRTIKQHRIVSQCGCYLGADCAGCCHCAQGAACHNVTGECPAQVGCSDCWEGSNCQICRTFKLTKTLLMFSEWAMS